MAAFSTKGLTVWLEKYPATATTPVTVSAVTNSKPAVATVGTTAIASFAVGDLVTVSGTGMTSLDGKSFVVTAVDDTAFTITLGGSDASGETAGGTVGNVTNVTGNFVEFCVATIEYQQAAAQAISVGTTCDPSAQIAGEPQAGTVSVTGFVDFAKEGYRELRKAVNDQQPRDIWVKLPTTAVPSGTGSIIYPDAVASGYSETFGVGQAAQFTAEFTLGSKPTEVTT